MISAWLSTREDGGHLVVTLRGELDVVDATSVAAALAAAAARNPWIIIDLAELEFIDCSGLHVLARAREQARQAGGDLLLAAPRRQVWRILALTGLADVFSVHTSLAEVTQIAGRSGPDPGGWACIGTGSPVNAAQALR
jgi:anti-sigma B factor antagonist